ncbi:MAG: hypothetical protein WHT07_07645 [Desulfobaccales bacterium]
MLAADLYFDKIDLARYFTLEEAARAGAKDPADLAALLKAGELSPTALAFLPPGRRHALTIALRPAEFLPQVPSLELPRPVPPDLVELNDPGPDAPLLVTGNSEFTLTVMTALLALTVSPLYLLLVECRGDTVDMAMVFRSFTPQRLDQGLTAHKLATRLKEKRLILPGVLAPLKAELAAYTGWEIQVGPICAAELPLFLGEAWQPPT